MRIAFLALAGLFALGCSAKATEPGVNGNAVTTTDPTNAAAGCVAGQPLAGATYDVTKSRFAFGSTPVEDKSGTLDRWVGSEGVVGLSALGSEVGIANAGAPGTALGDWSSDSAALEAHALEYFASMGVESCQVSATGINSSGGSGGTTSGTGTPVPTLSSRTVVLSRAIGGIRVAESLASARFNTDDQTSTEAFYWPTIPADVVTAATAFAAQLGTPAGLAAYKAKLPANAQGTGDVVIHHATGLFSTTFAAAATYDVIGTSTPELGTGPNLSFDANGQPVTTAW